jgi:hypothetical protein
VAKASLRQGQIVFAPLIPERGEVKLRPAVIYTPDAMLGNDEWVRVVAISTSCRPNDPHIPFPTMRPRVLSRGSTDRAALRCLSSIRFIEHTFSRHVAGCHKNY